MTGFDIAVLLASGLGATFGLLRGFVHEVLAILAWVAAVLAIRFGHAELSAVLRPLIGTGSGAAVLAFAVLLLVPYFAVRLIARQAGSASRASVLGPVDRVLGLGFGALKGTIIIIIAFSVAMLGYDTIWGAGGRPAAITEARSYPFVNAASNELVTMLAARRRAAAEAAPGAGAKPER
ncbi:MAG: CvpA family protein [Novosphingobium sp.]